MTMTMKDDDDDDDDGRLFQLLRLCFLSPLFLNLATFFAIYLLFYRITPLLVKFFKILSAA